MCVSQEVIGPSVLRKSIKFKMKFLGHRELIAYHFYSHFIHLSRNKNATENV